ncbi:nucleoside-diphosphate-sugar epimerase [Virgibacillus natechei]|uniref:Nucleoside-diphosphate-sugar epimerase n=1 Tax=Virgibacillus natechei TaxID=1216297 RepID=A0ABS4IE11_9BACI|nr:nucleoside-diphosphate-sugar epimerase [Virgibacillus natechei]
MPMQPGDVQATYADIDELTDVTGFKPTTTIDEGLKKFVEWYREYYG